MTRTPEPPYWDHRGRREWLRRRAHRQLVTFNSVVLTLFAVPAALTVSAAW